MKTKKPYLVVAAVVGLAAAVTQSVQAALPAPLPERMNQEQLNKWRSDQTLTSRKPTTAARVGHFYTGKAYQAELRTYSLMFRSYDPELHRWTTLDPSGYPDGANNYLYVTNGTTFAIDPDGLAKEHVGSSVEMHEPDCDGWEKHRGDGGDWIKWYQEAGTFYSYLNGEEPKPGLANLAQTLVSSNLGLNISGSQTSWTAYGGEISWEIYKEVQGSKTTWTFEFTVDSLTAYDDGPNQSPSNPRDHTPINATGTITATTE
jgi:RHS repeat-associated protein